LTDNSGVCSGPNDNPLSRNEQEQLRNIAKVLDYKPGTTLYSQGDEAKYVHLIADGIIRISHCNETGLRQILVFRMPGDFCGIPSEGHYFNFAESISKTTVYRFEWRQLQQIFLHESHLQATLLGKILSDYREAQLRISALGQQNTCQRLASFILDFMRIGALFDHDRNCLTLPVNRFDLADYLGTGPESTARAFAKLESLGLIRRITARKIRILDKTALQMLNLTARRRSFARDARKTFKDHQSLSA
jgi:CRP-like cAMP-binding protein